MPPEHDVPSIEILEPLCAVFRQRLKAEGHKYTPERARVLDAIIERDRVFQADQLVDDLKDSGFRVSKATVYRTIKLLQDAGIIQRVPFNQDQAHYILAYGRAPNDLLINTDTGEVIAVSDPELEAIRDRLAKAHGLRAHSHRLQIFAAK